MSKPDKASLRMCLLKSGPEIPQQFQVSQAWWERSRKAEAYTHRCPHRWLHFFRGGGTRAHRSHRIQNRITPIARHRKPHSNNTGKQNTDESTSKLEPLIGCSALPSNNTLAVSLLKITVASYPNFDPKSQETMFRPQELLK